MRRWLLLAIRVLLAVPLTWGTAALCRPPNANRSIASMALVLEVLIFATFSDWLLAVLVSTVASLAFSWYYVDSIGSFSITSLEGGLTLSMMLTTSLVASGLAIRSQRRAAEAIRRREEMERLQRLGEALVATTSVSEAASRIVTQVIDSFGLSGARLSIGGSSEAYESGSPSTPRSDLRLQYGTGGSTLELYGTHASEEVRNALSNLIDLVLDRARGGEERARIEAAQHGDELRTTVLNALAHNFKTPLTSIKAASSMLRASPRLQLSPDARELAAAIDEEADRLSELIRDSLELAKLQSHTENPRRELCSLREIAHTVAHRADRYLKGRNLFINVPDDLSPVWGDPFLFEQMLTQVVDNAWKYSRPGAEIRIFGEERNKCVILTIQNEGNAIPEHERERIFGKFYRGTVNRSQVEGSGLGLAIARTIVEAHGGNIWLETEPDGPAFRFSLPIGDTGG